MAKKTKSLQAFRNQLQKCVTQGRVAGQFLAKDIETPRSYERQALKLEIQTKGFSASVQVEGALLTASNFGDFPQIGVPLPDSNIQAENAEDYDIRLLQSRADCAVLSITNLKTNHQMCICRNIYDSEGDIFHFPLQDLLRLRTSGQLSSNIESRIHSEINELLKMANGRKERQFVLRHCANKLSYSQERTLISEEVKSFWNNYAQLLGALDRFSLDFETLIDLAKNQNACQAAFTSEIGLSDTEKSELLKSTLNAAKPQKMRL